MIAIHAMRHVSRLPLFHLSLIVFRVAEFRFGKEAIRDAVLRRGGITAIFRSGQPQAKSKTAQGNFNLEIIRAHFITWSCVKTTCI